jgi:hypothetical protein
MAKRAAAVTLSAIPRSNLLHMAHVLARVSVLAMLAE